MNIQINRMYMNKPVAMTYRPMLVIRMIYNMMEENIYQCIVIKLFGRFGPVAFMKVIRLKANERIN